jgi:hypothetical protein
VRLNRPGSTETVQRHEESSSSNTQGVNSLGRAKRNLTIGKAPLSLAKLPYKRFETVIFIAIHFVFQSTFEYF